MKKPAEVTAALQIAQALRGALAGAMEEQVGTEWDTQILVFEFARLLALVLRNEEITPSQLDDVLVFLRQVYAGVFPTALMSIEEAVQQFCSGHESGSAAPHGGGGTGPTTLH